MSDIVRAATQRTISHKLKILLELREKAATADNIDTLRNVTLEIIQQMIDDYELDMSFG